VVAFVSVRAFRSQKIYDPEDRTASDKRGTRIRLSGESRSEPLDQVNAEIERGGPRVDLDLQELDLADVESVRFLNGARRRVSQCCAARLISGNGCSGSEGLSKAPTHKRNRGMAGWRKKMESRYGEVHKR
jgi:hypothetical protein